MRILNFGSLNIDHVYHVDHFVRPGETISSDRYEVHCGGKGLNQSIALARAGAAAYHAGKIGYDGDKLKETLDKNHVNTDYLEKTDEPNGHALIQIAKNGENAIIIHGGSNRTITGDYVDRVLRDFGPDDMVLMQNEISCIAYIARQCAEKGIKIAFNPSPLDEELLRCFPFELVSLLLVNEIEGYGLTGKKEPDEILDTLREKYPDTAVVLTLGSRGSVYRDRTNIHACGTYDVKVVDTTAAGDTFTGYFLSCLSAGCSIPECLKKASAASSLAVSRAGASSSIPTMEEVEQAMFTLKYTPYRSDANKA